MHSTTTRRSSTRAATCSPTGSSRRATSRPGWRGRDVVEDEYRTQFIDHAYLEPEAGVAWRDTDGVITIRAATQVVEHFRDVARILDLPDNRVRLITPYVGGGFGGKEDMTVEPYLGVVVALTGRPVRMVWSRQESLLARQNRHAVRMRYRTGADADGTPGGDGRRHPLRRRRLRAAQRARPALLDDLRRRAIPLPERAHPRPNRVHEPHPVQRDARLRRHAGGARLRGTDGPARPELGIDPLELRRRNFVERGDKLPIGQELETAVELPALIDALSERLGEPPEPSGPRRAVGRGFACNLQPYGRCVWLNDWSSAWIGFELDGTLVIRIAVPDIGGGQASSLVQIASEVLGVAPERIAIHIGDSALNPLTGTTTATRQLYMSGNAVLKAARELRDQLAGVAAELLEVDAERVEFGPGGVRERDGERSIGFRKLLAACASVDMPWHVLATYRAPKGVPWQADESWRGRVFPDFTYGCHAADVEVDLDTGQVRVLRYVAAHDVGQAINPQSVEGQIEGAVAMGLGYALSERVVFEEGQNLTGTFAQYLIPTAVEVPAIDSIVLESGEGMGPFNARGIGEPPIGPPAPAVAAAIHAACGVTLTQLPFTPERVAAASRGGRTAMPRVEGSELLSLPRAEVWAMLNDPETLGAAIPGCRGFERDAEAEHRFRTAITVAVGAVRGVYEGTVLYEEVEEPERCTIVSARGDKGAIDGSGADRARGARRRDRGRLQGRLQADRAGRRHRPADGARHQPQADRADPAQPRGAGVGA